MVVDSPGWIGRAVAGKTVRIISVDTTRQINLLFFIVGLPPTYYTYYSI
jgi:hypothetical protein